MHQKTVALQQALQGGGERKDALQRKYLEIQEMLTREELRLDGISLADSPELRPLRKAAVQRIERSHEQLEKLKPLIAALPA